GVFASLVLLSVTGSTPRTDASQQDGPRAQRTYGRERHRTSLVATLVVVLVLGTWLVLRELVFAGQLPPLVRGAMAIVLVVGAAFVFLKFTAAVDRLLKWAGIHIQGEGQMRRRRLLVVALAVPWLVLFGLAEPGIPERFLWLLPLQILVLAAFAAVFLPRFGVPRPAVWLVQALQVVA